MFDVGSFLNGKAQVYEGPKQRMECGKSGEGFERYLIRDSVWKSIILLMAEIRLTS